MKPRIKIICVAYEREIELGILIDCFRLQSCPDWELNIVYDGKIPAWYKKLTKKHESDQRICFYNSKERNENYGHPNRRGMLEMLEFNEGDFLLMTNDDNYYVPRYIEIMLSVINESVGMIYCNTVHSHFDYRLQCTEIKLKRIDIGAFIVRANIAKETGFNYDDFNADGIYAEECKRTCDSKRLQTIWIQKPLFIHN